MKRIKNIVWITLLFILVMMPIKEVNAEKIYRSIDYSSRAYANRVNMIGKPGYGDCAIASIASIEAYWDNSTDGKYDEVYSLFNGVFISSWSKVGYTSKVYDIQKL